MSINPLPSAQPFHCQFFFHQSFHRKIKRKEALIKIFCFLILGETSVHIAIVNGDLESLKLLIEKCSADVHARARGRFFIPEDCKDKMKTDTDYDGEWKELPTLPSRKKVPLNKAIDVQTVSNGQVFGAFNLKMVWTIWRANNSGSLGDLELVLLIFWSSQLHRRLAWASITQVYQSF